LKNGIAKTASATTSFKGGKNSLHPGLISVFGLGTMTKATIRKVLAM